VTGTFRQIAVDVDFITPLRRYLIQDLESGVNTELVFNSIVPVEAFDTPTDGTTATATCINLIPVHILGSSRFGEVKCVVAAGGFALANRARARRQNYAEDGRPGITIGTRTWIVTMLQIPGEHQITEDERKAVSPRRRLKLSYRTLPCYCTRTTAPWLYFAVLRTRISPPHDSCHPQQHGIPLPIPYKVLIRLTDRSMIIFWQCIIVLVGARQTLPPQFRQDFYFGHLQ
jgi:hypothetical protein